MKFRFIASVSPSEVLCLESSVRSSVLEQEASGVVTLYSVLLQWPGSHLTRALVHRSCSSQRTTAQYRVRVTSTE
jgi:hypothetical protein